MSFIQLEYISLAIDFFLMFVKRYEFRIALLVTLIIIAIIQIFDIKFKK